jgi:hypothetical protein
VPFLVWSVLQTEDMNMFLRLELRYTVLHHKCRLEKVGNTNQSYTASGVIIIYKRYTFSVS